MRRAPVLLAVGLLTVVSAGTVLALAAQTSSPAPEGATASDYQLRKLVVPPDGQVYLGMFIRPGVTDGDCTASWKCGEKWGDSRPYSDRVQDTITNELGGKKLAFLRVWAGWQYPGQDGKPLLPFSQWFGDITEAEGVTGPASAVFLDWSLTTTMQGNGGLTVKDIAAGKYDTYIATFATDVRRYGKPLLIRLFGGELNGSWWWGQSPLANPSLTTADFVNAWRRVVDIFRREGALNASWAWNVNATPPFPVAWEDTDLAAYWPGDDYVDWAGADIYDSLPISYLDVPYDFAVAHNKPFFLAEWGVRIGGSTLTPTQQNDWLNQMFDYFETHPAIKAISYFNYNGRADNGLPLDPAKLICLDNGKVCYQQATNDYDHRLLADSDAGWRQTFARRVASPRYLSDTITETVTPARAGAVVSLGQRANGTTVRVRVGDTIVIRLTANPSTGYSWRFTSTGSPVLRLLSSRYVPPAKSGLVGAPGAFTARLAVRTVGSRTVALAYRRHTHPPTPAARHFQVSIIAR